MEKLDNFKEYSYNDNPNADETYNVTLTHTYEEHCHVLSVVRPTYYIFAVAWTIVAFAYEASLFAKPYEARLKF